MVFIPPTSLQIERTARDAVSTLRAVCGPNGNIFFVGSFACKLYGDHVSPYMTYFRSPNDVDIVVETHYDQEELKRQMVRHNPTFFLQNAKTPGATYKVLKHGTPYSRSAVKVDVLIANVTMNIPSVPEDRVKTINGFPACPLAFLILLRLQAWDHHRVALVRHLYEKAAVDVRDLISYLLPYARNSSWRTGDNMMEDADAYLPDWFMRVSRERVQRFITSYGHSRQAWKDAGAQIVTSSDSPGLSDMFSRLRLYR